MATAKTPQPAPTLPDSFLTPEDIAAKFRVPLETVYQWRKKRTGPPGFRVGKHLRYDPIDVQAYVDRLKTTDLTAA
ncbi:helix-turn-helix domain-containing protein [Streptomyces sp. NPDC101158]|uniref:helix-turn-helix domain-containing protein n=1 Tax=Streptomyces sp. NPDC101158 TaxID=3366117 RepID=UPI0038186398